MVNLHVLFRPPETWDEWGDGTHTIVYRRMPEELARRIKSEWSAYHKGVGEQFLSTRYQRPGGRTVGILLDYGLIVEIEVKSPERDKKG